ncbi:MAG TPA: prepilin-type N-terminal cleavage/methylation domain-containing protein [Terriglobales bacterium]|nr:prepilin-type N-terminal cleavage/methylation domain-containing protein [Terriglobales bacterium]
MSPVTKTSSGGFSLLELLIALVVGLIVIGAAVQLYSSAMDATWVVQQRSEMQQDLRAAENMILKDLSLAGSGLNGVNSESVPLPVTSGTPLFGCTTASPCSPAFTYPCIGGACSVANPPTLFPIMPGYQKGITPPGAGTKTDIITVVYSDTNLALNCYSGTLNPITFNVTGNVLTFQAPPNPPPTSCVMPAGQTYPIPLNDPVSGLKAGDLVMVGPSKNGGLLGIGEITAVSPAGVVGAVPTPCTGSPCTGGSTYTITFADNDPLKLNQAGKQNDLTATSASTAGVPVTRIFVITYYLGNWTDAAGNITTVLYRQVNGQPAVPLVDNIANMQFTYDTYAADGTLLNASGDGGEAGGTSPSLIRKVNLAHLTIRSQLYGARGGYMNKGYQSFDVQTSISARNLSYNNRY